MLAVACGSGSLDEASPAASSSSSGSGGTTLPPIDPIDSTTGSTDESTGAPIIDDPRLCEADCRLTLPVDWVYQGVMPPPPPEGEREPPPPEPPPPWGQNPTFDPRDHGVPVMLRDPSDGSLILAEQWDGHVTLHHLDRDGHLERNVAPDLPCDVCELTHIAWHPSGDLLLSATGLLHDRGHGLIAARYDPVRDSIVWTTTRPLQTDFGVPVRSGEIAALSGQVIAQLYLEARVDFDPLQIIKLVAYDDDGTVFEDAELSQNLAMEGRHPILARTTVDGDLLIGFPTGNDANPRGVVDHVVPPLWGASNFVLLLSTIDDLHADERGHALELGHVFDGERTHLVLVDRADLEPTPRWTATLGLPSTTGSRATLAVSPSGEPYTAVRTTQALGDDPASAEPLVGFSITRWTTDGELRATATVLDRIDDSDTPVEIAIDDDDGIILATVVDDRLRVERRTQRCDCG